MQVAYHPSDKRHFKGSVDRARDLRRDSTDAERKLWSALRGMKANWRRQVPIGPYIADFAHHGARLIVELDGGQHAEEAAIGYDQRRTTFLEGRRYRVLRFWNNEVAESLDSVMGSIQEAMAEPALPRPADPPSPWSARRRLAPPASHGVPPRAPPSAVEGEG